MPAAYIQKTPGGSGNGASTSISSGTFPGAVVAGSSLAYFVAYGNGSPQTAVVAGNSNVYVEAGAVHNAGVSVGLRCGYVKAANTGTTGATATLGNACDPRGLVQLEYSGLELVGSIFVSGETSGLYSLAAGQDPDDWSSGLISPAVQPYIIIACGMAINTYEDWAAGTGFNSRGGTFDFGYGGGNSSLLIDRRVTTLGDIEALFTRAGGGGVDGGIILAMILREAAEAASPPPPEAPMRHGGMMPRVCI